MKKTTRRLAVPAAALSAAALVATAPASAYAATPSHTTVSTPTPTPPSPTVPTVPTFSFRDCPALPAGVDPAKWRCEVLVADGTVTLAGRAVPFEFTAVTHAEGPMPDGTPGQVFGGFRAAALPAAAAGRNVRIRPELVAVPDFYSRNGAMSLLFRVTGPGLGDPCTIGTRQAPVQIAAGRVAGTTRWISQQPPIITFDVADPTFSVPAVTGCGHRAGELNTRLGLPSPSGANALRATVFYSFESYQQLSAGQTAGAAAAVSDPIRS